MKLLGLCLLAVGCFCFLADVTAEMTLEEKKLEEVLLQIDRMNRSLQHNEVLLNTPSQDIEDCCWVSALRCFHQNLKYLNVAEKKVHVKLQNSLKHSLTEKGLDFCNQGKAEPTTCQNCTTYPKASSKEFVIRLKSLFHRALAKIRMTN